jgi:hypothetical protein
MDQYSVPSVRVADPDDSDDVVRLMHEAAAWMAAKGTPAWDVALIDRAWVGAFVARSELFVASSGDVIVGACTLSPTLNSGLTPLRVKPLTCTRWRCDGRMPGEASARRLSKAVVRPRVLGDAPSYGSTVTRTCEASTNGLASPGWTPSIPAGTQPSSQSASKSKPESRPSRDVRNGSRADVRATAHTGRSLEVRIPDPIQLPLAAESRPLARSPKAAHKTGR